MPFEPTKEFRRNICGTVAAMVSQSLSEGEATPKLLISCYFNSMSFAVPKDSVQIFCFYAICIYAPPSGHVKYNLEAETIKGLYNLFMTCWVDQCWGYSGLHFEVVRELYIPEYGDINGWVSIVLLMFLSRILKLYIKERKPSRGGVEGLGYGSL